MLSSPRGVTLSACEAGAIFPVACTECRERLYYPTLKTPVPFSAEVIITHTDEARFAAECFADRLRGIGYQNVVIESEASHVEHGCPVG